MLSTKMEQALNDQLAAENYSAHLYLAITAYFRSIDLSGFANWMQVQYQEEISHSLKFFDYIDDRDGKMQVQAVEAPPSEWASPLEAYEASYAHEKTISENINDLVTLALAENDHSTNNFLQWFVAEQVEEVSSVKGILQKLKFAQNSPTSILMLDQELAKRTFVAPAA